MKQWYFGKLGEKDELGLIADARLVVWVKGSGYNDLSAVDSIQEVAGNEILFYCEDGKWNRVHVLLVERMAKGTPLFFGKVGENGLLADKRLILWDDKTFYLEDGIWEQVHYTVEKGKREPVSGLWARFGRA